MWKKTLVNLDLMSNSPLFVEGTETNLLRESCSLSDVTKSFFHASLQVFPQIFLDLLNIYLYRKPDFTFSISFGVGGMMAYRSSKVWNQALAEDIVFS